MTNRERWVIYPLLFLAIALGLRDKILVPPTTEFRSLRCHNLTISSEDGSTALQMGQTYDGSGLLLLHASSATLPVTEQSNPSENNQTAGRRTLEFGANDAGGYIKVFADPARPALELTHDPKLRFSGLIAVDSQNQTVALDGTSRRPWGTILPWDSPEEVPEEGQKPESNEPERNEPEQPQEVAPVLDTSSLP